LYGDRLFVILKDQADVSAATQIADRDERLTFVYQTLTSHANTTQADIRQTLDRFGVHYTPYYLVNAIEVDNNPLVRLYLATRSDVDRVLYSPRLRPLPEPESVNTGVETTVSESPGWNIKMIGADQVWTEFGATGQGIVVGQSDSGVDGDHPALSDAYRGQATGDDYNWFDPWEGTTSPNDEGGHGTHTMGTVLGGRGIGVAPGAQWIGCVNLERNLANPALYLDCMQFMLAPFPHDGNPLTDGDPALAAHVLNNSWGCPVSEGCDPNALLPAVDALRAAGIFVVASAGNDGPACGSV
ncbi:MAG: S8 family serine peptidase, partial [Chloroflexota bacterium]